jgi:hypothetical protein
LINNSKQAKEKREKKLYCVVINKIPKKQALQFGLLAVNGQQGRRLGAIEPSLRHEMEEV